MVFLFSAPPFAPAYAAPAYKEIHTWDEHRRTCDLFELPWSLLERACSQRHMRAIHVTRRCVARLQSRSPHITWLLATGLPGHSHFWACAHVSAFSGLIKAADKGLQAQTSRARHWRNGSVRARLARTRSALRSLALSCISLCFALH